MPTSSQSKILSTVDYQIQQQQQANPFDSATKPIGPVKSIRPFKGNNAEEDEERGSPPPTVTRRRSSVKINEGQIRHEEILSTTIVDLSSRSK